MLWLLLEEGRSQWHVTQLPVNLETTGVTLAALVWVGG